jgi:hypothetical protein
MNKKLLDAINMESAIEMNRSSLVLPTSGYELDREEMCYVEGGGLAGAVGGSLAGSTVGALA